MQTTSLGRTLFLCASCSCINHTLTLLQYDDRYCNRRCTYLPRTRPQAAISASEAAYGLFLDSGGIWLLFRDSITYLVRGEQIYQLVLYNQIPMPEIQEIEIEDKSTSDTLARAIASFQTFQFLAHFLSRLALGLPISPIEVQINGVVICTTIIYALWWKKPLDAKYPICTKTEKYMDDVFRVLAGSHSTRSEQLF
jgi:hypothetical protein